MELSMPMCKYDKGHFVVLYWSCHLQNMSHFAMVLKENQIYGPNNCTRSLNKNHNNLEDEYVEEYLRSKLLCW